FPRKDFPIETLKTLENELAKGILKIRILELTYIPWSSLRLMVLFFLCAYVKLFGKKSSKIKFRKSLACTLRDLKNFENKTSERNLKI
ncbi:MAG: hypothetical protein B7Z16_04850, partial [Algoriphagus sp. 32-45-6]